MKSRTASLLTLALLAGLAGVAGCSSTPAREQLAEIRANPSPVEETLTKSTDDIDNQYTVTFDENLRGLNRDLGVLFLLDRPTRLSPYPMR
ncbi:MAG: hypothetical protein ACT4PL_05845 [Phycisphaerales bacterium]